MLGFPRPEHEPWDRKRAARSGVFQRRPKEALECEDRDPSWYLQGPSAEFWALEGRLCVAPTTTCVHSALPTLVPRVSHETQAGCPEQWGE